MNAIETMRPDFVWLKKLTKEQGGLDRLGVLHILGECEQFIASLESRLSAIEERDDWLRKQLDGLIESAEVVVRVSLLPTARAMHRDLRDARKALPAAEEEK